MPAKPTDQDWRYIDKLPDSALVDANVLKVLYGKSRSAIVRDEKAGLIPNSVKLGPACKRWVLGEVRSHIETLKVRS